MCRKFCDISAQDIWAPNIDLKMKVLKFLGIHPRYESDFDLIGILDGFLNKKSNKVDMTEVQAEQLKLVGIHNIKKIFSTEKILLRASSFLFQIKKNSHCENAFLSH